jgi:AraC family transcriptional activator of pobA
MKHIYKNRQTNAYFSVETLHNLAIEADFTKPHPWFTLLIVNSCQGDLVIDDTKVLCYSPTLIFLTPGQHFILSPEAGSNGFSISFNQEFYCIEFHDSEVSCNGLLFLNNFSVVQIPLDAQQQTIYNNTVKEIVSEFEQNDPLLSEMLKNLLKNLLIRSNRLFRTQNATGEPDNRNIDSARKFSELVEKHFREFKQVDAYADMMGMAPASLTKKLQKFGIESPSRIIKNRIITEAKRMLIYTDKSVKEISYFIGFEDQHYFSRLFSKETGISPTDYKKQHQKH